MIPEVLANMICTQIEPLTIRVLLVACVKCITPHVLTAFCLSVTIATVAGQPARNTGAVNPFGLHMGQKKQTIGKIVKEVAPYTFLLDSVPKPHRELEIYRVTVAPKSGLCSVRGMSPDVKTTNGDAAPLQAKFERMSSEFERLYGKPERLGKKFAMWSTTTLPTNSTLSRITISAVAPSAQSGYIAVQYYFVNNDQCRAETGESER